MSLRPLRGRCQWNRLAVLCTQYTNGTVLSLLGTNHQHAVSVRHSSNKGEKRREQVKQQVTKYVGDNAKLAERVYVWGNAVTGALGIASFLKPEKNQKPVNVQWRPARLRFIDKHDFKVKDVACGYGFTLFVVKRGKTTTVLGTGINTDSQLGYHEFPRKSGRVLDYIIEPGKIDIPLKYPDTTKVKQVSCGRAHSVIVTDTEGVFSLGNNSYGQCGRPIVEGELFNKVSNISRIENLPDDVIKTVCGQDHTFFLTASGAVYSCGLGADGQTGLGTYNATGTPTLVKGAIEGVKIVDIAGCSDCVLAVSDDKELFGWGNSEYYQLSLVTSETQVNTPMHIPVKDCGKIVQVSAGGSICALLNDEGQVFVWGFGILGLGPMLANADHPSKIPETLFGRNELQPDMKVKSVHCGMSTFAAVTDHGDLFTWGKNKQGCLGLAGKGDQYFPLKVAMAAETYRVVCGVDHMVALCRSFS